MLKSSIKSQLIKTSVLLYAIAQFFFLINIQFPAKHSFDEFHYVPSAKQILESKENQNWEHPPLGKQIMAVSIGIWGDRPIGWRFFSTVFGALTLVGMYLWGFAVFRDQRSALSVALITLANQLLFVQARIGMLDTFMFAFLVWGLASFCATWNRQIHLKEMRNYLVFAGVMFGLATASKWFAVVPWFGCLLLIALVKLFHSWGVTFISSPVATAQKGKKQVEPESDDWYHPTLFSGVTFWQLAFWLGVVPLLAYFVTFLPFLAINRTPGYTLWDLVMMTPKMYDGQLRVVNSHPYMSKWTDWAIMKRPIWYAFDKEGEKNEFVRGVLLLGNPAIMWGGLVALAVCFWSWAKERSREAFLILAFYAFFYLSWMMIPRKVAFYYYYYPAGMTLSLAIVFFFRWLEGHEARSRRNYTAASSAATWGQGVFIAISLALFTYFYPILAAVRIPSESFRQWMWIRSWI